MLKTLTNKGRVLCFNSLTEMVDTVCDFLSSRPTGSDPYYWKPMDSGWAGRHFSSWDDLKQKASQTWEEGVKTVKGMLEKIKQCELPRPKSIRRRPTWNENDGDVDVDRYLCGDDNFYRRGIRQKTHSINIVNIVFQMGESCSVSSTAMFWRGAAVVAAIDHLEDAGYSCELTAFSRTHKTYFDPQHEAFVCCKVKNAGEDLNIDTVTNALSGWMFRNVVMGGFNLHQKPKDRGYGWVERDYTPYSQFLDLESGCVPVTMPKAFNEKDAVEAVKNMINQMIAQQED